MPYLVLHAPTLLVYFIHDFELYQYRRPSFFIYQHDDRAILLFPFAPKYLKRGIVHLDHVLFRFVCAIELSSVSPSPTSKKEEKGFHQPN
jgi:hypothetical protein